MMSLGANTVPLQGQAMEHILQAIISRQTLYWTRITMATHNGVIAHTALLKPRSVSGSTQ
jgi:hypothetical protein